MFPTHARRSCARLISGLLVFVLAATFWCYQTGAAAEIKCPTDYVARKDYGQKLEPAGNRIIHGAGRLSPRGWRDFETYSELLIDRKPTITTAWVGLKDDLNSFFSSLETHLNLHSQAYLIPQISLMLNVGEEPEAHYEDAIARGELDDQIQLLGNYLQRINRPLYLRIGFAFNGEWNNYDPETYKEAYRRIWQALSGQYDLGDRVAFVWSYSPAAANRRFEEYYPGDDAVDWWALDIFNIFDVERENTRRFLRSAANHEKPVMIAEATALGIGTEHE